MRIGVVRQPASPRQPSLACHLSPLPSGNDILASLRFATRTCWLQTIERAASSQPENRLLDAISCVAEATGFHDANFDVWGRTAAFWLPNSRIAAAACLQWLKANGVVARDLHAAAAAAPTASRRSSTSLINETTAINRRHATRRRRRLFAARSTFRRQRLATKTNRMRPQFRVSPFHNARRSPARAATPTRNGRATIRRKIWPHRVGDFAVVVGTPPSCSFQRLFDRAAAERIVDSIESCAWSPRFERRRGVGGFCGCLRASSRFSVNSRTTSRLSSTSSRVLDTRHIQLIVPQPSPPADTAEREAASDENAASSAALQAAGRNAASPSQVGRPLVAIVKRVTCRSAIVSAEVARRLFGARRPPSEAAAAIRSKTPPTPLSRLCAAPTSDRLSARSTRSFFSAAFQR